MRLTAFNYVHGYLGNHLLIEGLGLLLIFEHALDQDMYEEVVSSMPEILEEQPVWSGRILFVSTMAYPSVSVRLGYSSDVREHAALQDITMAHADVFDRVTEYFDDEPEPEEVDAFLMHVHRWLTQVHQHNPLSLVIADAPILSHNSTPELLAYDACSTQLRPDVLAWMPLELSARGMSERSRDVLMNMLFGALLEEVGSLDAETKNALWVRLLSLDLSCAQEQDWVELFDVPV